MKTTVNVRKVFIVAIVACLTIAGLIILFISPLTKYILEKYDVRWLGRELTMDWAYVNPFTGYVRLSNFRMLEEKGDSLFWSAAGLSANISVVKLFNKKIEIKKLTLDRPWIQVQQREKILNFDDLIQRFSGDSTAHAQSGWRLSILGSKVIGGEFHFLEKIIPINYFIKKLYIESDGLEWGADSVTAKFSFEEGKSNGEINGNISINIKNSGYRLALTAHDFDLEIMRQYIWELINYGMFRARFDAKILAVGNFKSQDSINLKGQLTLRDFHLGKTTEDDYLSFKKLVVAVGELDPAHHIYLFDSILLSMPYLKYERYDSLDNIQTMFGKKGKNITDITGQPSRFNLIIEIARYVEVLSQNFFRSDYKIGKIRIHNADLVFNDYSLSEKFSIEMDPLTITADSINKNKKRVAVQVNTGLKPFGQGSLALSINPKDSGDFDLMYKLEKIPASLFNPYLISYTSFPLDRGTIELNGLWHVNNSRIKSSNHVVIMDPRFSKRIRNKDLKWIPMPLIMSFIRERGNVIDYSVPITGNLKDPKFHLGDIVFDLVKNIFIKPPTIPYGLDVKNVEAEIEKSVTMTWPMRQHTMDPLRKKFIHKMSGFLKDNPHGLLQVHPLMYGDKEREYILFFETKKKYFLLRNHKKTQTLSEQDSLTITKMSVKDPALVKFLGKNLSDTVMFTLQEKCINFVGSQIVNTRLKQLAKGREASFLEPFKANGTEDRVKIHSSADNIPYNGFSFYKLEYPGELPNSLRRAYQKMNDLNDEGPRKKYLSRRKQEAMENK